MDGEIVASDGSKVESTEAKVEPTNNQEMVRKLPF